MYVRLAATIAVLAFAACGGAPSGGNNNEDTLPDGGRKPGSNPNTQDGGTGPGSNDQPDTWPVVQAATFTMGSTASDACRESDEDAHSVTLTRSFAVQPKETTQGEFEELMGYNPANKKVCGATCPVENMNWYEAAAYCNALSAKVGLDACYTCEGTGEDVFCELVDGAATPYDCRGYRLPTEAEWEAAYRAGSSTSLYNGDLAAAECNAVSAQAAEIGWYNKNAQSSIHPVGEKTPNALGLYDLAGNVQEWVHDLYTQNLGAAAVTDPVGGTTGNRVVIRGGSFAHKAGDMRASHRKPQTLTSPGTGIGFRCVRTR